MIIIILKHARGSYQRLTAPLNLLNVSELNTEYGDQSAVQAESILRIVMSGTLEPQSHIDELQQQQHE